jgi:hypothetical protein
LITLLDTAEDLATAPEQKSGGVPEGTELELDIGDITHREGLGAVKAVAVLSSKATEQGFDKSFDPLRLKLDGGPERQHTCDRHLSQQAPGARIDIRVSRGRKNGRDKCNHPEQSHPRHHIDFLDCPRRLHRTFVAIIRHFYILSNALHFAMTSLPLGTILQRFH